MIGNGLEIFMKIREMSFGRGWWWERRRKRKKPKSELSWWELLWQRIEAGNGWVRSARGRGRSCEKMVAGGGATAPETVKNSMAWRSSWRLTVARMEVKLGGDVHR